MKRRPWYDEEEVGPVLFLEGLNEEITLTATKDGLVVHPTDARGYLFGPYLLEWSTLDRLRKAIPDP